MKYLAVILCLVAGVSFAGEHEIVLMDQYTIAAGETNTVETPYKLRGLFRQMAVWQDGEGVTTTTVYSVRGGDLYTLAVKAGADGATKGTTSGATIEHGLYDETIRFVTINYATNSVTVTPAIIYEK